MEPNAGCVRLVGALFVAAGVWIILGAAFFPDRVAFSNESGDKMPQWLNILFGGVFLVLGAAALDARRIASGERRNGWIVAIVSVVAISILGAVLGDPNDESFPQGRWAAVVAALVFVVGGATILANSSKRERLGGFLALIIITLLGVLLTGLLLQGAEADSGELLILGVEIGAPAWLDNVMLAFFAVLIDIIAVVGWFKFLQSTSAR